MNKVECINKLLEKVIPPKLPFRIENIEGKKLTLKQSKAYTARITAVITIDGEKLLNIKYEPYRNLDEYPEDGDAYFGLSLAYPFDNHIPKDVTDTYKIFWQECFYNSSAFEEKYKGAIMRLLQPTIDKMKV